MYKKFKNPDVAEKFSTYTQPMRSNLMKLRQLIFDVAASIEVVGELEEDLKWGDPSFLTTASKSGSMIRINTLKTKDEYAIFFLCQTSLVKRFRELYPETFTFAGNRALIFNVKSKIPVKELKHCISMALTYRLAKKAKIHR